MATKSRYVTLWASNFKRDGDGFAGKSKIFHDVRLVELNFRMYEIVKSVFYDEGESFDKEMDKVIQTIRYVREM